MTHTSTPIDRDGITPNLREYLDKPEVVAGWVTPQALVLLDGQMLATDYFNYGQSGLMLRSALPPEHRESHQGLFKRFHAGERLDVSGLVAMSAQARQAPSAADRAGQKGMEMAAMKRFESNGSQRDPNLVYENGSDDTFWNTKVLRQGERFNVEVYDADGDRRPDRENSFEDQTLAIAFADRSILRASQRDLAQHQEVLGRIDSAFDDVNALLDASGALEGEALQKAVYQLRLEICRAIGDAERIAAAEASLEELPGYPSPGM